MTINWKLPIETVSGIPARVLCTDRKGSTPVVVLTDWDDVEGAYYYHLDGTHPDPMMKLQNRAEERTIWVNVYPDPFDNKCFRTKEAASSASLGGLIATIPVTYKVPHERE